MKKTNRLNAVDIMLILLATVSLLSCLLRFRWLGAENNAEELSTYRILLRFDNLDASLAECYRAGEVAGTSIGEWNGVIASVGVSDAKERLVANGKFYEATWDTDRRCSLLVEVDVRAFVRDGVLYLDGRYATAVSDSLMLCTNRTRMTGIIYRYAALKDLSTGEFTA